MIDLRALFALTLRRPGQGARALLDLGLPMPVIWMALGVTVAGNAILSFISLTVSPPPPEMQGLIERASPIGFALFVAAALLALSVALTVSGRALGGTGRFAQLVLVLVWLQGAMLVFEAALIVALLVAPPLAAIAALPLYALTLVWLVAFTQQAHGFAHPLRALGAVLLGLFGLGFVLSLLI